MNPIGLPPHAPHARLDAERDDAQFGDSLRAAARRTTGAPGTRHVDLEPTTGRGPAPSFDAPPAPRSQPASNKASPTPAAGQQPSARTAPREGASSAGDPPAKSTSRAQAASHADESRPADRRPADGNAAASSTHAAPRGDANVATDRRDARLARHGRGQAHARSERRHDDPTRSPDGVPLQTLLAAAHPLQASDGATPAATASAPLTPQDVAASVTQAWLHETTAPSATAPDAGSQWTFELGDPLTPLAALRVSGDATTGWALQLTAGNGLPARELAAQAQRLRQRLQARGQAVDRVEVDDDTRETS